MGEYWMKLEAAMEKAVRATMQDHTSEETKEAIREMNRIFQNLQTRFYPLPNGDVAIFTDKQIDDFPIAYPVVLLAGYVERTFEDGTARVLKSRDNTFHGVVLPSSTEPKDEYLI
jgi:hypothetical protein